MQRRSFLRAALSGGVVVTMPAFLQACGAIQPAATTAPPPDDPFLEWFGIDQPLVARIMAELGGGADDAEIFFQHRRRSELGYRMGAIDRATTDIVQGAGLRVVRGDTVGFAATEDLTPEGLLRAARDAAGAAAAGTSITDLTRVPDGELYVTTVSWADVGVDRKLPLLERIERDARSADATVSAVDITWSDTDERILIATLDGRLISDRRPMTRLSAQVTMTRNGVSHSGFANIAARADLGWYTDDRIDGLVDSAIERTAVLFDARRPPNGEMPVVLSAGTGGVLLHEAIGHSMEADFVRDGVSPYADAVGTSIADVTVTIVDQGTLPGERGALNVDDEGTPSGRTVLVEAGRLEGFLHDRSTARQFGTASTASGRRETYRDQPMPRMTCTFMENGPHERDELIESMGRGIIADTFVGGNVSLGHGDFAFNVKHGWLVEKGRVLMPVRDFRIVGNGPDTLRNVTMVANDARMDSGGWSCGKKGQTVPVSQGMPSVLVSRLGVEALS